MHDIRLTLSPTADVNVPLLRHHAPSGAAGWGYLGSGPADTALRILAQFLPVPKTGPRTPEEVLLHLGLPSDDEQREQALADLSDEQTEDLDRRYAEHCEQLPIRLFDGQYVSRQAWQLHQEFKRDVLGGLNQECDHVIEADTIHQWIHQRQTPDVSASAACR
ncbi:hypothetical protein [Deinococcus multiflagellatus]|uniref:Uncharacterized protein n=1 Tax=Deinococcus multiflagellatus TaxID=1656887 RepID=A0ABW1ZTI4_9DEIO|nr:hypothetical protein [Deinococcus multiflagellatus]MBZ9714458.1 hypothetical protein [Deinococcus multiflagellatus]